MALSPRDPSLTPGEQLAAWTRDADQRERDSINRASVTMWRRWHERQSTNGQ